MRLIDADALIMALRLEYPMIPMFKESHKEWEKKTEGYRKAEEIISEAPTIDAVSVVRCKECRFGTWDDDIEMYDCAVIKGWFEANHYCGYGERKESE